MGEMRPVEQAEAMREERVRRRVEAMRQAYLSGKTVESAFEDTGLMQLPGENGKVRSIIGQGEKKPVLVNTDEGVVMEPDREMVTEQMWNCITVVIVGPNGKELAHMTPGDELPYRKYRYPDGRTYSDPGPAVERMVQPLRALGDSLEQYRALIIMNRADAFAAPSKFNYPHQEEAMKNLASLFESAGLRRVRVAETSLTETLTYHTPDRPEEVLVVGKRAMYDAQGHVVTQEGEVGAAWIPIEGEQRFQFLERPSDIIPGKADDIIPV